MNTININLTAQKPTANYVTDYGPYTIRGTTIATFDLTGIAEEKDPVLYVNGNFGDGENYTDNLKLHNTIDGANAVVIFNTGKSKSVDQFVTHTYTKNTDTFITSLTAIFNFTYASNFVGTHKVSFNILKDSYYDTIKHLNIFSTQVMPVTSNDVFALMSDANGDVFNMVLSK